MATQKSDRETEFYKVNRTPNISRGNERRLEVLKEKLYPQVEPGVDNLEKNLKIHQKALWDLMIAYCRAVSPSSPIDWDLLEDNIRLYLHRARLQLAQEEKTGANYRR